MPRFRTSPNRRSAAPRRRLGRVRLDLHPFTAAGLAIVVLAMAGWSAATTTYVLFRDDVLNQIIASYSNTEKASAAEISRLKADLVRLNSRMLVERESFSGKLDALARRQTQIEQRHETLNTIARSVGGATETTEAALRLGAHRPTSPASTLQDVEARYAALEKQQKTMASALKNQIDQEKKALTDVYADLGIKAQAPIKAGIGGLYIPLSFGSSDAARRSFQSLEESALKAAELRAGLDAIPIRRPTLRAAESSGFGSRMDPFLGKPAFHSGIDFAVPTGSKALATAAGTVTAAGWNGGYGLMVDVSHEHGFSTRYAHLSSVNVEVGQVVKPGDIVGLTGSTGRSTGPHLHYETRHNDRARDPRRFLAAGAKLAR